MHLALFRLAVAVFTLLLAACGGGGGSTPVTDPAIIDPTITAPAITNPINVTTPPVATDWVTRSRSTTQDFNGIAYSGSRFVALGGLSNIAYSSDGLHWTVFDSSGIPSEGITWGNNLFVAVGSFGQISTSPDGITWTKRSECPGFCTDKLLAVNWSGTRFVAVGEMGMIYTSDDALTWTARTSGTTATLTSVAWSGNTFVAVGDTTLLHSADGISWAPGTMTPVGSVSDVMWDGNRFLASGWDGVYASVDGVSWNQLATEAVYNIAWNGSVYVGDGGVNGMKSSLDAVTWVSEINIFLNQSMHQIISVPGSNQFVAVGGQNATSGLIATSSDGTTWHVRMGSSALSSVVWDGTRFMAIDALGRLFTSADGAEWDSTLYIPYRGGGVEYYVDLAWSDTLSRYVTISNNSILYSPDGITWSLAYFGSLINFTAVTWTGSEFVAVAYNGAFYRSSDGITWGAVSTIALPAGSGLGSPSIQDVAWSSALGLYLAGGNGYVYTSPDGVSWTPYTLVANKVMYGVAWAGDKFVAVGSSGTLFTSADGATWVARSSGTTSTLYDVSYSAGEVLAVGSGKALTSVDGITWSSQTMDYTYAGLVATAKSPTRTVAVGSSATILSRP